MLSRSRHAVITLLLNQLGTQSSDLLFIRIAYLNSKWTDCIENINLALQHYKQDWMRCREFCSAFPVSKAVSVVSAYRGVITTKNLQL